MAGAALKMLPKQSNRGYFTRLSSLNETDVLALFLIQLCFHSHFIHLSIIYTQTYKKLERSQNDYIILGK